MTKIKICGLSREEEILFVNALKPDYIGFVFARGSKRYVSSEQAACLRDLLDDSIQSVGVFVDQPIDKIKLLADNGVIQLVQLHGREDEDYIKDLRAVVSLPIIKAFRIESAEDIKRAQESSADYVLLDNGNGGTGETFDWRLIADMGRPYFLAGGLSPDNVADAVGRYSPYAVDTSSGVETGGVKDYIKIRTFIEQVNGGNKR